MIALRSGAVFGGVVEIRGVVRQSIDARMLRRIEGFFLMSMSWHRPVYVFDYCLQARPSLRVLACQRWLSAGFQFVLVCMVCNRRNYGGRAFYVAANGWLISAWMASDPGRTTNMPSGLTRGGTVRCEGCLSCSDCKIPVVLRGDGFASADLTGMRL